MSTGGACLPSVIVVRFYLVQSNMSRNSDVQFQLFGLCMKPEKSESVGNHVKSTYPS